MFACAALRGAAVDVCVLQEGVPDHAGASLVRARFDWDCSCVTCPPGRHHAQRGAAERCPRPVYHVPCPCMCAACLCVWLLAAVTPQRHPRLTNRVCTCPPCPLRFAVVTPRSAQYLAPHTTPTARRGRFNYSVLDWQLNGVVSEVDPGARAGSVAGDSVLTFQRGSPPPRGRRSRAPGRRYIGLQHAAAGLWNHQLRATPGAARRRHPSRRF